MMSSIDRKIKIQILKDNLFAIVFASVMTLLLAFLPLMNTNLGERYDITGVVESITGMPSDQGDRLYLLIRLDDGKLVRSYIRRSTMYKQGKVVKLTVIQPRFFGRTKYKFKGYAD